MSLQPTFLARLADPEIRTVILCGCGGGFDFVHSLTLYPELKQLGKNIIIGSYSFGDPDAIEGVAPVIFEEENILVKKVTAASIPSDYYAPEIHVCSYLDHAYPDEAPHFVYAYYARAFTIASLIRLYTQLIDTHKVDAIILMDGGSDSLMVGDEEGLGDPVEDAVSVGAVAELANLKAKILISIGLGVDRFNHVADAASLRAVAELTAQGGFLGTMSLEPTHKGFQFYKSCIEHIYARQTFRSVLAGAIISAVEGHFGADRTPPLLPNRVKQGSIYLWPLMSMLWVFDVDVVAKRSLIVDWIRDSQTPRQCHYDLFMARTEHGVRPVENLPPHETMRSPVNMFAVNPKSDDG